jgi:hypothetical protein
MKWQGLKKNLLNLYRENDQNIFRNYNISMKLINKTDSEVGEIVGEYKRNKNLMKEYFHIH